MSSILLLAWRSLAFHRMRSLLLIAAIALTLLLPLCVHLLVGTYTEKLEARAAKTPLLLGRPGSRYDLVLNALYFQGRVPRPLQLEQADALADSGLGLSIPLLAAGTVRGFALVGTSHDYHGFRGLVPESGTLPLMLGDAVLGADVGARLELGPGATVLTDQGSLYDLTASYPLRLKVTGVLAPSSSPDDGVIFIDLKTGWILAGLGHGHDPGGSDQERVLAESEQALVLNASVVEATEITEQNIDDFHFHGDLGRYPVTAALVIPNDPKSATLLKGRYRVSEDAQLLSPADVVAELLGFVLRVKRFFDANLLLVSIATALFLALIVTLSLRVRRRELLTLFRIGVARPVVFRLLLTELALILLAGIACGVLAAFLLAGPLEKGLLLL